jgi:predicted RecB family nuclease
MKSSVTKYDWLTAGECQTKAWYGLRAQTKAPSEADLFRMEQGREVGELAQQLYPSGVLVQPVDGQTAAQVTQELITDNSDDVFFEAAFRPEPLIAKADILKREAEGWHVLEVKSSFSDTKSISDLIDDLSYTVMVLLRARLPVTKASLVLLSREFRHGDGPEKLFEIVDKTTKILARAAEFEAHADAIQDVLLGDDRPEPSLVSACRTCPHFEGECLGAQVPHTVLELPNLHHTKLKKLSADGIIDLASLPTDIKLNATQLRARDAALSNQTIVDSHLATALGQIEWPCYYLDFETVATVLPLYEEHACHQQVLTQFSIHERATLQDNPAHHEYFADASRDCQRELAERLIGAVGNSGSIIVYSHFENRRINALRDTYDDLAGPLQQIIDRLVDLHQIVKAHVYNPDFKGSFSIKKVLPALVSRLSYEGLAVADGDTAMAQFARMARGAIVGEEGERTRKNLLDYCKLDTLAMVQLHDALQALT